MLLAAASAAYAAEEAVNTDELKYDFGAEEADGWQHIPSDTLYSPEKGFGFNEVTGISDIKTKGAEQLSDAISISPENSPYISFDVDLEPGLYDITIYSGDINQITIWLEGHPAILNMQYENMSENVEIPVTDGQLNVSLSNGNETTNLSLSALSIKRVGDVSDRKRRIFVCGDSIASTYYPKEITEPINAGHRGGWGQMLQKYIKDDYYVMNLSSPGQHAKSFIDKWHFDSLLYYMQPDDYVFIAYGINDNYSYNADEYKKYMSQIIEGILEHKGIPIIVGSTPFLDDFWMDPLYKTGTDKCYAQEAYELAQKYELKFVSLHYMAINYFEHITYRELLNMYFTMYDGEKDPWHFSRLGSDCCAALVAGDCADIGIYNNKEFELPSQPAPTPEATPAPSDSPQINNE